MKKEKPQQNNSYVSGGTGYRPDFIPKKPGAITIYPLTGYELQIIKSSNSGDTALNICLSSASAAISFAIAFFTCNFNSIYSELIFLFVAILLATISIASFIFWRKTHTKSNELYNEIINRENAVTPK